MTRTVERQISEARREERRLRARMEAVASNFHPFRAIQTQYLRSFSVRVVACFEANTKRDPSERLSPRALVSLAERIDMWLPSRERAYVGALPKTGGGERVIIDFGLENKARQHIARAALMPIARGRIQECQFAALKGRGRDAACVATARAAEREGYRFAAQYDIVDCYASMSADLVECNLPLPREVVRCTLLSEGLNLSFDRLPGGLRGRRLRETARRGIPPGSAASSLVCDMVLARLIPAPPAGGRFINYADNFACLGKTRMMLDRTVTALESALAVPPVGPLSLQCKEETRRICDGVKFLGYLIRYRPILRKLSIKPSAENWEKFLRRMVHYAMQIRQDRSAIAEARSYFWGWVQAFSATNGSLYLAARTEAQWICDEVLDDLGTLPPAVMNPSAGQREFVLRQLGLDPRTC